jgi:hypothetical protein
MYQILPKNIFSSQCPSITTFFHLHKNWRRGRKKKTKSIQKSNGCRPEACFDLWSITAKKQTDGQDNYIAYSCLSTKHVSQCQGDFDGRYAQVGQTEKKIPLGWAFDPFGDGSTHLQRNSRADLVTIWVITIGRKSVPGLRPGIERHGPVSNILIQNLGPKTCPPNFVGYLSASWNKTT